MKEVCPKTDIMQYHLTNIQKQTRQLMMLQIRLIVMLGGERSVFKGQRVPEL